MDYEDVSSFGPYSIYDHNINEAIDQRELLRKYYNYLDAISRNQTTLPPDYEIEQILGVEKRKKGSKEEVYYKVKIKNDIFPKIVPSSELMSSDSSIQSVIKFYREISEWS